MTPQLYRLRFGNKGIAFAIDALLAVIAVVLLISIINSNILASKENSLDELNIARSGSDLVTILDYKGHFNSPDSAIIQNISLQLLPRHHVRIQLDCSSYSGTFGSEPPADRFIASGKRFTVRGTSSVQDYCTIRYWTWLR